MNAGFENVHQNNLFAWLAVNIPAACRADKSLHPQWKAAACQRLIPATNTG